MSDEPEEDLSTKGAAVLSTINLLLVCMTSQSAAAPENIRMNVKLAASILVCFSAARQRSELLANAIIAINVRKKSRAFRAANSNAQRPISKSEIGEIFNQQSVRNRQT